MVGLNTFLGYPINVLPAVPELSAKTMKTNLTNWLCGLCAILLIVVLVIQFKQQGRLDALQRQQESLSSAVSQQQQQQRNLTVGLAKQVTNLGVSLESRLAQGEQQAKEKAAEIANAVQQQTAVMHRALGKVIPVELPESLTNKLTALEARATDEKSWPKDSTETDAMLAGLRDLVRQIPPWAEEDLLPRLNALRWNVQSLQVLQANASVDGEALSTAAETFANQISTQPDGGLTNITTALASRQADAMQRFAVYRRESAIKDAKEQLGLAVTTEALAVWQRLSEWTNDPTDGQQVLELRQQLRSRLLEEEVAKFTDATKASLQKFGALTNVALRRAGYFRTMENVTVQRLKLLEEPNTSVGAVNMLADVSASVEARINEETEKQKLDDYGRDRGYQQWALRKIADFRSDFVNAQNQKRGRFGDSIRGPEIYTDYGMIRDVMVKHLLPVSLGNLDSAVAKIYGQAFDDGWNKLGGKDEKHLQTEVAEKDETTAKKTPQNYQE